MCWTKKSEKTRGMRNTFKDEAFIFHFISSFNVIVTVSDDWILMSSGVTTEQCAQFTSCIATGVKNVPCSAKGTEQAVTFWWRPPFSTLFLDRSSQAHYFATYPKNTTVSTYVCEEFFCPLVPLQTWPQRSTNSNIS